MERRNRPNPCSIPILIYCEKNEFLIKIIFDR
jgi:hypothetical protein